MLVDSFCFNFGCDFLMMLILEAVNGDVFLPFIFG